MSLLSLQSDMEQLKKYLHTLLGNNITIEMVDENELARLPYHITNAFDFRTTSLYGKKLLLLKLKNTDFKIGQIKKQLDLIAKVFKEQVVLVADKMHSMNKKRLIESGIQFIVPEKQLFLPGLLIDLKEDLPRKGYLRRTEKLTPSAQFILLYQILHRYEKLEKFTFKELSKKLGYTAMGVTKAIAVLEQLELCEVEGTKEKHIHFNEHFNELWEEARPYLINPVLKTVFVDELPKTTLLQSNVSALPEYSNMAPSNQKYYAIERTNFYALKNNNELVNPNEYEGKYCLEVWKYNPNMLTENVTKENNIDPLSLFLSLKDRQDERIELALDQIIEKFIW